MSLRSRVIRVAFVNPHLRESLLPLLVTAKEWPSAEALHGYLDEHPNADAKKHSVRKDEPKKPAPETKATDTAALHERAQKMKTPLDEDTKVHLLQLQVTKFPAPKVDRSTIHVHLNADPAKEAIMDWVDTKGNTQRAYATEFLQAHAAEKWKRVEKFRPKLEAVRTRIQAGLKTKPGSREHEGATIAAIIAETGLRPGGRAGSTEAGHFGVSTLRGEHVKFDGDTARLEFIGKAGKKNVAVVQDPEAVKALRYYVKQAGDKPLFDVDVSDAREVLPTGMKLKDLRTIIATETAEKALKTLEHPPPLDKDPDKARKQIARAWLATSKAVAERLNNTPAIARAAYIHPRILEAWVQSIGGGDLVGP